ncbi:hypothetical protein T459_16331 [Capsicum annuum]|uniref:Uncharacterized protein n=1 Tax=Capsicum annuum TaxID=4072 RepID=A0A2G2Z8I2_CAPAN|nr:hypothetical protein FXO37_06858 [Capsicum annuum]PHT78279.1 hypothetical protein T459_16331 [Capsicum annuum]
MVLHSFQDPHPRVRWAAVHAIHQLLTDFFPYLQAQYHNQILPALAVVMDDLQNPRVQAFAAASIVILYRFESPDTIEAFVDGLLKKLVVLLQNNNQMVHEEALIALGSIADLSKSNIIQFLPSYFVKPGKFSPSYFSPFLRSVTYIRLDGSVEREKRFDNVKAFNSDITIDVFQLTKHELLWRLKTTDCGNTKEEVGSSIKDDLLIVPNDIESFVNLILLVLFLGKPEKSDGGSFY